MNKERERETWSNIIDVYRELPYMWDKKHKDYFNRDLKQEVYNNLLLIHNEGLTDKEMTVGEFKKKFENMRTTYARELKKVIDSKQTGSGSDGVYTPTLWYYTLFDFLQETYTHRPCRFGTDCLNEITANTDPLQLEDTIPGIQYKDIKPPSNNNCDEDEDPPMKKQRLSLQERQEKILDCVCAQKLIIQKEEEWEVIGKSIGLQIRDIDENQRIIVQKLISDAIFYGKLGKLTERSRISLEDKRAMSYYHQHSSAPPSP